MTIGAFGGAKAAITGAGAGTVTSTGGGAIF